MWPFLFRRILRRDRLGTFGLLALVLAAIGTYGVMSYSVNQRTQEIGIRMALGAQPGNVMRLILANGMAMVVAGIVVGLGLSALLAKSMNTLLYGVAPMDPATFIVVGVVLVAVSLVACYVPARRAMRIEPMEALRYE